MTRASKHSVVRLLTMLVVATGSGWLWPTPIAVTKQANDSTLLDLSAMMLTPEDLEAEGMEGYGLFFGQVGFLDELSAGFAGSGGRSEDEVRAFLKDAGFLRWHDVDLGLPPDGGEPEDTALRTVRSYVAGFNDEDGAAESWDVFEDETDIVTAEDVRGVDEFGDESEATRDRVEDAATGDEGAFLDLSFRLGNLHAGVGIVDWTGEEPEVAEAEALAARLVERIEAVVDDGAPGLSNQILRLTDDAVEPAMDSYVILHGEALPYFAESARERGMREEGAENIAVIDEYWLVQFISAGGENVDDDIEYSVNLRQFGDDAAAADWFAEVEAAPEEYSIYRDVVIDEDAPSFGDESITLSARVADERVRFRVVVLRVGATIAWIDLVGPERPPFKAIEPIADAQAECLEDGACPEPLPLPDELADYVASLGEAERERDEQTEDDRGGSPDLEDLRIAAETPEAGTPET